jgi:hypothetical protein
MRLPRVGVVALILVGACTGGRGHVPDEPAPAPQLIVLMQNMNDLALEWEFFDSVSDSIAAGMVKATTASWCAKIPIPANAETARLFNGLQDLAFRPAKQPYWTLEVTGRGAFLEDAKPPC